MGGKNTKPKQQKELRSSSSENFPPSWPTFSTQHRVEDKSDSDSRHVEAAYSGSNYYRRQPSYNPYFISPDQGSEASESQKKKSQEHMPSGAPVLHKVDRIGLQSSSNSSSLSSVQLTSQDRASTPRVNGAPVLHKVDRIGLQSSSNSSSLSSVQLTSQDRASTPRVNGKTLVEHKPSPLAPASNFTSETHLSHKSQMSGKETPPLYTSRNPEDAKSVARATAQKTLSLNPPEEMVRHDTIVGGCRPKPQNNLAQRVSIAAGTDGDSGNAATSYYERPIQALHRPLLSYGKEITMKSNTSNGSMECRKIYEAVAVKGKPAAKQLELKAWEEQSLPLGMAKKIMSDTLNLAAAGDQGDKSDNYPIFIQRDSSVQESHIDRKPDKEIIFTPRNGIRNVSTPQEIIFTPRNGIRNVSTPQEKLQIVLGRQQVNKTGSCGNGPSCKTLAKPFPSSFLDNVPYDLYSVSEGKEKYSSALTSPSAGKCYSDDDDDDDNKKMTTIGSFAQKSSKAKRQEKQMKRRRKAMRKYNAQQPRDGCGESQGKSGTGTIGDVSKMKLDVRREPFQVKINFQVDSNNCTKNDIKEVLEEEAHFHDGRVTLVEDCEAVVTFSEEFNAINFKIQMDRARFFGQIVTASLIPVDAPHGTQETRATTVETIQGGASPRVIYAISVQLHFQNYSLADDTNVTYIMHAMLQDVKCDISRITHDFSNGDSSVEIHLDSRHIQKEALKLLREKRVADIKITAQEVNMRNEVSFQVEHDECYRKLTAWTKEAETKHHKKVEDVQGKIDDIERSFLQGRASLPNTAAGISSWECKRRALTEELHALKEKRKEFMSQQLEFVSRAEKLRERIFVEVPGREGKGNEYLRNIYLEFGWEKKALESALPILAHRTKIMQLVRDNQVCLVKAETGSGKSTQIVQYLYRCGYASGGKKIVCTQPRKIAASSLSEHVTKELMISEVVGHRLGPRGYLKHSILYLTDLQLLREVSNDPLLTAFSCVVVDEAHERSLHTDLLLGVLKDMLTKRDDLKVVVTSATLDTRRFQDFFDGCPLTTVPGRIFPVEVVWEGSLQAVGKNGGDYLRRAVEKAAFLHNHEPDGDILVFLATPQDTEKAKEMLEKKLSGSNVQVLQLHGRLQQQEQRLVFDPARVGYRKVIFSTNSAETSLTIPGIVYVVDAGIAKERMYNAKWNTSSLVLGPINRSSAEQRKGRAGRMAPGKCFRLYSKKDYEDMKEGMVPEILRTHLGQAILRLVQLGVSKPLQFNFLERPSDDALEAAMLALTTLAALVVSTDGVVAMTDLGTDLAKLPLAPSLGHLLLRSLKEEEGHFEALCAVSIMEAAGSAVFFRAGSEENIQEADSRRMLFCQESGDLMTAMEVFIAWWVSNEQARGKWCKKHYINGKSMKAINEVMKEVKDTLRREFGKEIAHVFSDHPEEKERTCDSICHLVAESQVKNLCVYRGHPRLGYTVVESGEVVKMHPSASFSYLGKYPQLIVFDQILKTSQDFMHGVNEVKSEWVDVMLEAGKVSREKMDQAKATCATTQKHHIGSCFLRAIKKLKTDLDNITTSTNEKSELRSMYVLDYSKEKGLLQINAAPSIHNDMKETVDAAMSKCKDEARSEKKPWPLSGADHTDLLLGSGGIVVDVLLPGDFLAIVLESGPTEVCESVVQLFRGATSSFLMKSGKEVEVRDLCINFSSTLDARSALLRAESLPCKSRPYKVKRGQRVSALCVLEVEWPKRKCNGRGKVEFNCWDDYYKVGSHLGPILVRSQREVASVKWRPDKKDPKTLFIPGNLPPFTTEADLEDAVKKWLVVEFKEKPKVVIFRDASKETAEDAKKRFLELLSSFGYDAKGNENVQVFGGRNWNWIARVYISDPFWGSKLQKHLNGVWKNMGLGILGVPVPLTCKLEMQADHYCSKKVYSKVKEDITSMSEEMKLMFKTWEKDLEVIDSEVKNKEMIRLKITTPHSELLGIASHALRNILDGERIALSCSPTLSALAEALEERSGGMLNKVQLKTNTIMQHNYVRNELVIFGTKTAIETAKIEMNKILQELDSHEGVREEVIVVSSGSVIAKLLAQHGPTLVDVGENAGACKVHMQLYHKSEIHVLGNQTSIQKVRDMIDDTENQVKSGGENLVEDDLECGICFTAAVKCVSLNVCGHVYCKDCLVRQLEACVLPLKCSREDCGESWSVWDVLDMMKKLPQNIQRKFENAAVQQLLAVQDQHSKCHLKFCPSPNCSGVFRTGSGSEGNSKWTCPFCSNQICTRCQVLYHHGMTCEDYDKTKIDEDYMLKKWVSKDPANRKLCPNCRFYIEKNEGCNHMTCERCKVHFCWRCLEVKSSAIEVHFHQPYCKGDTYLEFN